MNMSRGPSLIALPFIIAIISFTGCGEPKPSSGVEYTIPDQPEMSTGYTPKPGWTTSEFAVAAANPIATDAGYQILKSGGSAVDAAIAVQLVLNLVEPQSSGIGGGAFLLNWDGTEISAYDGREIAPSGANENLFIDEHGDQLSFSESVNSGLSVGVPGTLAMLKTAHQNHGKLPWADLFKPAITLAEEGFSLSPRLHQQLKEERTLQNDDIARAYYYNELGDPHPIGYNLQNPAFAEILKNISEEGISAFYTGDIPKSIANRIKNHPRPGPMTEEDINAYPSQDFQREAMCTDWRSWRICGFPPPSSGHIAIMQILGIMDKLESLAEPLIDSIPSAPWMHQYLEAAKLSFADRNMYVADPEFIDPPADSWYSLLEPDYLAKRALLIGEVSMGEAEPGVPGPLSEIYGTHPKQPEMGTSHISIIDGNGNAIAMTTTIEQGFGSRIMTDGGTGLHGGFHLNNELTDFSRTPIDNDGRLIANRVEPGKRPRSSMSPTLVFNKDTGELYSSVGSPGGAAIIHYTAKALIGMLDWKLNAQEAINLPNFANYNGPSLLESDRFSAEVIEALESLEHEIIEQELTSGLQAIQCIDGGFYGGADPRREGVVMGD